MAEEQCSPALLQAYRSYRNRQMVREETGQETQGTPFCVSGQPVIIPIMAFAAFCQASVQSKGSMESERHEADVRLLHCA